MIKKIGFFVVMAAIIAAFGGCQKEELTVRQLTDEVQPQEVVQPDVYVKDDYLVFKDVETYSKISDELDSMTEEEYSAWEKGLGFFSARSLLNVVYTMFYPKFVYNQNIPDYTSPETTQGCTYLFMRYYDVLTGYYSQVIPEIYNNNFTFWSRGWDYSNRITITYSNQ